MSEESPQATNPPPSPGSARRLWGAFLAAALGFVILAEVNYLNDRHYHRFDLTANRRYSLSPKSIQIVRSLVAPVRVETTFVANGDQELMALDLITEYGEYSDHFIVKDNRNFMGDPTGLQEFAARYKFTTLEEALNKVVLDYNDGERVRVVKLEEMLTHGEFDPQTGERGEATFQGEEAISGAILDLTEERKTGVYFTVGHGELDIQKLGAPGLAKWRRFLEMENYKVDTIDLLSREELPGDCDVLVIPGATDPFRPEEEEVVEEHLRSGGRLLILAGYADRPGLEGILLDWGVDLREDLVVLPRKDRRTEIIVGKYRPHPITDPLEGSRITPYHARSVDLVQDLPEGVEGSILFESPVEAWGETRYRQRSLVKDGEDNEGPLPMAVALERKGEGERPARLVVVGSVFFAMNARSFMGIPVALIEEGANDDLALNLVGWLAARDRVVGIGGKRVGVPRVRILEGSDKITIYLICLAILPGICLVAGLSLWWVRRG